VSVGGIGVKVARGRRVAVGGARVGVGGIAVPVTVAAGAVAVAVSSGVGEVVAVGATVGAAVGVNVGMRVGSCATDDAPEGIAVLPDGAAGEHAANANIRSTAITPTLAAARIDELITRIKYTCL
jgi:hypothetical protein